MYQSLCWDSEAFNESMAYALGWEGVCSGADDEWARIMGCISVCSYCFQCYFEMHPPASVSAINPELVAPYEVIPSTDPFDALYLYPQ